MMQVMRGSESTNNSKITTQSHVKLDVTDCDRKNEGLL